jgi:hypothetical protein
MSAGLESRCYQPIAFGTNVHTALSITIPTIHPWQVTRVLHKKRGVTKTRNAVNKRNKVPGQYSIYLLTYLFTRINNFFADCVRNFHFEVRSSGPESGYKNRDLSTFCSTRSGSIKQPSTWKRRAWLWWIGLSSFAYYRLHRSDNLLGVLLESAQKKVAGLVGSYVFTLSIHFLWP